MPLSTQTLAWETVANFFLHAALPVLFGFGVYFTSSKDPSAFVGGWRSRIIWLVLFLFFSYAVHTGLLAQLQIESCSGVKDWGTVLLGALKAVAITLVFAVIPLSSEWMRLLVSQVLFRHKMLALPSQVAIFETTKTAGDKVAELVLTPPGEGSKPPPAPTSTGTDITGDSDVLEQTAYNFQTFREMIMGWSYMSAFGGAIGFAAGSWGVADCKGTGGRRV